MSRTAPAVAARSALAAIALAALASGCTAAQPTSSSDAAAPTSATAAQGTTGDGSSDGLPSGCVSFGKLMKSTAAAVGAQDVRTAQAAAGRFTSAAAAFKGSPGLRDAAQKLAEYFTQEAAAIKNADRMPDYTLLTQATEEWKAACA